MHNSNDPPISTASQGIIYSGVQMNQGLPTSVQMWSQPGTIAGSQTTDSSGRLVQSPRPPILGPLVFASPAPDGTTLVRAPMSILSSNASVNSQSQAATLSPFTLTTQGIPPTLVISSSGPVNGSPIGSIVMSSSQSASTVLDQTTVQSSASTMQPKVVSLQSFPATPQTTDANSPQQQPLVSGHESPANLPSTSAIAPMSVNTAHSAPNTSQSIFTTKSLIDIVKETDPDLQLDDETEEALRTLSEEFIESVTEKATKLAMHRGSSVVEAKDMKFCMDRDWNVFVPGFPIPERNWKRPFVLQAHKQRLAVAKKQLKRS